jgi:hypothetical protein
VLVDYIVAVHLCNLLPIATVALAISWRQVAVVAYLDIGNERPRLALR